MLNFFTKIKNRLTFVWHKLIGVSYDMTPSGRCFKAYLTKIANGEYEEKDFNFRYEDDLKSMIDSVEQRYGSDAFMCLGESEITEEDKRFRGACLVLDIFDSIGDSENINQ